MMRESGRSAVRAGLLGGAVWLVPGTAQALSLFGDPSGPSVDALVPFAIGCVAGAAVTGGVSFAIFRSREGEAVEREARQTFQESARVQASAPMREVDYGARETPVVRGRHMRVDWENTGNIRVQRVQPSAATHLSSESFSKNPPAAQPSFVAEAAPEASHVAHDYEDVAENYVRRQTLSQRMAARAEGVKAVLSERMNADMMDGLPVIERADGTVADVGTSWWVDAIDEGKARPAETFSYAVDAPAEINFDVSAPKASVPAFDADESVVFEHVDVINPDIPSSAAADAERARLIASRLSNIDQSVYPEARPASSPAHSAQDMWATALEALDEQAAAPVDEVETIIGNMDSLDEPDGLEADTSFIPFRIPAGHPEVVDTDTYVDYLIDQEFSQNQSSAARHSSREFLHVIEGGSHKMRHLARRQAQEA